MHSHNKTRLKLKRIIASYATDYQFNILNYNYMRIKLGFLPRLPNLLVPKRFTDKIIKLKLQYRLPLASTFADKWAVREFVAQRIGKQYLIPSYGAFTNPDIIDFSKLPNRFVVKPNHASGIIRFENKSTLDEKKLRLEFHQWLTLDYYQNGREYQYRDIPRKIVFEKDMSEEIGSSGMIDYKFYCFNGEPRFIQVDFDRFSAHKRNFYDVDWNKLPFEVIYPSSNREINSPKKLLEMIELAKLLSSEIAFVRVDLYEISGSIFFGEITLHPDGGFGSFQPEIWDFKIGEMLELV